MATSLTDRPGPKLDIAETIFGGSEHPEKRVLTLKGYFAYYYEELRLLERGISPKSWQTASLAIKTYEDIFHVVNILRAQGQLCRPCLRQVLSTEPTRFAPSDIVGINRSMDLGIRLWLMVNVQDAAFESLRYEATAVQWDDKRTLQEFLHSLFPPSRCQLTPQSSRLGLHFTASFMQRVCGLKLEWTTSLYDHLRLDRERRALKIFPYKCHLQGLLEGRPEIEYVPVSVEFVRAKTERTSNCLELLSRI